MAIPPIGGAGAIPFTPKTILPPAPVSDPQAFPPAGTTPGVAGAAQTGFGDLVSRGIQALSSSENKADSLVQAMAAGKDVQPHQVLIATTEAQLSMELAVSLRNKALDAYREIMNMQL